MADILAKSNARFTTFPIRYPDLWDLYKKAIATFWTVEEIDFSKDSSDYEKMTRDEKVFINTILAFFAASDGIVFENISLNFVDEVQIPEARSFYAYQGFNESIHGETYSLMIDTFCDDKTLFTAIDTVPCVKRKADWARKYINKDVPFGERLFAFACVEGIFFSGSFCAIFWLKNRGIFPGLTFSNELISRDEGMHQEFALRLLGHLPEKPSPEKIVEILKEAVEIEISFIGDAIPVRMIGIDSEKMGTYIKFIADRLLKSIGLETVYKTQNPFDWMENIALDGKTNFFERRVGEYSKSAVISDEFNADF